MNSPAIKRMLSAAVAAAALLAAPAGAQVAPKPASGTPQLAPTGTTERVRQLVQCGGTMYAVGSFTAIQWNGKTYARENAFSFAAAPPYTVTAWNPQVNGEVNSVAFDGGCQTAYIGGSFTTVDAQSARNIAAVSTATGRIVSSFGHDASATVDTIRAHGKHLLVGGYFTQINGARRTLMASLNPATGRADGFVRLQIAGRYSYCVRSRCANDPPKVYNQQISHDGTHDLVEGVFTSVDGQPRQQAFMLTLGTRAALARWHAPALNQHGAPVEAFYARGGAWSPDDRTVYFASTGYRRANWNGKFPLSGLCDTASAFPARQGRVSPKWINYTGCDSLYSAAAGRYVVYFGGHERWSESPRGCDWAGPGAISAPGMEGVSAATGRLVFNPTRARGYGADDMVLNRAGLWIASDNFEGSASCGGQPNHAGICLLPRK